MMKQEYDFSTGERGKFYRKNAAFRLPVYLDSEVQRYLQKRAKSQGIEMTQLINEMLKQDIQTLESHKD